MGCSPQGHEESDTTEQLHFHFSLSCIGEGNGNPLQCSCLENPRDGGAWWAAVYGVAQSQNDCGDLAAAAHNIENRREFTKDEGSCLECSPCSLSCPLSASYLAQVLPVL